jgi:hypothetical protein
MSGWSDTGARGELILACKADNAIYQQGISGILSGTGVILPKFWSKAVKFASFRHTGEWFQ